MRIMENGVPRWTGCHPRQTRVGDGTFRVVGEVEDVPLLPAAEIVDHEIDGLVPRIVDQGRQNSCCPSAAVGLFELVRELMGLPHVELSQGSLYGRINDGRDQGATIDSALIELMREGVCPTSVIDQYEWHPSRWPANWREVAADYKVREAFDCPTLQHIYSCTMRAMPVLLGVFWTGGGGHAIYAVGRKAGKVKIVNSWAVRWGEQGRGYLPESQVERGIRTFGAWGCRIVTPSGGRPAPKAA